MIGTSDDFEAPNVDLNTWAPVDPSGRGQISLALGTVAFAPGGDSWVDDFSTRIEQLVEGDRTYNVVGGFGGWFPAEASQPQGPKLWKQSIAVFIALFPTVLLITLIRGAIAPGMNVVLAVFIGNVLGILILTYILMPPLTRRLQSWLSR